MFFISFQNNASLASMSFMKEMLPPILYQDEHVFVFNKPAGLMVHPDGRSDVPTLSEMLVAAHPEIKDVGEPMRLGEKVIDRPGIVHRLDTDTSGVIIVAKTNEAFHFLKAQFQEHSIQKVYEAFVYGHPQKEFGTIDAPIGRSVRDFRMYSAQRGARGEKREATTIYRVLSRFSDDAHGDAWKRFSLVELRPKTGRTHQLRTHMKYLNHPIVSDPLYSRGAPLALGFARTALHAKTITFATPDGKSHTVTAPYPTDFEAALQIALTRAKV